MREQLILKGCVRKREEENGHYRSCVCVCMCVLCPVTYIIIVYYIYTICSATQGVWLPGETPWVSPQRPVQTNDIQKKTEGERNGERKERRAGVLSFPSACSFLVFWAGRPLSLCDVDRACSDGKHILSGSPFTALSLLPCLPPSIHPSPKLSSPQRGAQAEH